MSPWPQVWDELVAGVADVAADAATRLLTKLKALAADHVRKLEQELLGARPLLPQVAGMFWDGALEMIRCGTSSSCALYV